MATAFAILLGMCNFVGIFSAPGSETSASHQFEQAARRVNFLVFCYITMYAIVEIQGQQFKAEAGKFLYVHYLGDVKEGDTVEFDRVLLLDADGDVKIGAPTVEGAKVVCEVQTPLVKGEKVIISRKSAARAIAAKTAIASASPRLPSRKSLLKPLKTVESWHTKRCR